KKFYERKIIFDVYTFFSMWKSYAQPSEIVGTVIEAQSKLPLTGVTVRFQGETSTSSTSTDESGRFVLKASGSAGNLSSSLVAYLAREVVYPGVSLQTIALTKENTALDEVVVVGYGTVRKLDLTGSVVLVKDDEIAKVPSANIIESIQGKMP